ncbi:hypothetical protein [Mycolicibacterium smegmatis]|uniref:hypothetical protein n=1 Tax=Mycolicibacterium smegmatis TaxID=1772 RepID=UPI001E524EDA|nr:hypothetical protein [Mycolicibacterium smegmatis]
MPTTELTGRPGHGAAAAGRTGWGEVPAGSCAGEVHCGGAVRPAVGADRVAGRVVGLGGAQARQAGVRRVVAVHHRASPTRAARVRS